MELRLLRTFVAVAELRHFAKAAGACNLSQPAVSHQIALLEEQVGARLLNRSGRRVSLTVAGEVLLEEARRILAAVDRARERMQEVASGAVGRIRLGATATPGLYLVPPLLAIFRARHPTYDLAFEIGAIGDIADRVARNELDMAVISGTLPTTELQTRQLAEDNLVLIAAPQNPLASLRRVVPADLSQECWILREEGSDTRRRTVAWLDEHRLAPARTMTFEGPDAVKRAVMAGLGISMASRLTSEEELHAGRLAAVRCGVPLPARHVYAVDHPHKHHGAACRAMLALFDERFGPVVPRPARRRADSQQSTVDPARNEASAQTAE